ncbi:MAG: LysM peptidoglycan-binding domain-containing protein [Clostridia bacterium]|nr:LysM peptidoglycan-binding domain-containing protein [Clostridia bacterium]
MVFFVFIRKLLTGTALAVLALVFWFWPGTSKPVQVAIEKQVNITPVNKPKVAKKVNLYADWVKHSVESGDNLYYLAKMGKTSVEKIMAANQLTSERLDIGQVLLVPKGTGDEISKRKREQALNKLMAEKRQPKAIKLIAENNQPPRKRVKTREVSRSNTGGSAELIPWEEADGLYNGVAKVIDVETGKSFMVKRNGGHEHADSDPLTAEDTAVLRELYGGEWSWNRRAIILEVDGRRIAASMNGMPHGRSATKGNGFPGHFCIHFLGSRTHGSEYTKSGAPKVDAAHQAMVHKAADH